LRHETHDLLVVGGGSAGAGLALDAALRGRSVALIDAGDFGGETSSASTKLAHGGVRYLEKAVREFDWNQYRLVREALRERQNLLRLAPHLGHVLPLAVPVANAWERFYFGVGLKLYDALAGRRSLGSTRWLSSQAFAEQLPALEASRLAGGWLYTDGQFDDANYNLALARTATAAGAVAVNYVRCISFSFVEKDQRHVVQLKDEETGREFETRCRIVANCTGAQADRFRLVADPESQPRLRASSGVHVVVPREVLPVDVGWLLPETADGRVLFVLPWMGRTLVGTTDTPHDDPSIPPEVTSSDVHYLSDELNYYLRNPVDLYKQGIGFFAGLRPLVGGKGKSTQALIRNHEVEVVPERQVIHVLGGKWTTYRQMAKEAADAADRLLGEKPRPCRTEYTLLAGGDPDDLRWPYGCETDRAGMSRSESQPWLPVDASALASEVEFAVRYGMARRVEDVLVRRLRWVVLDYRAALEQLEPVAWLMASMLHWDEGQTRAAAHRCRELIHRRFMCVD
jgi:glycerol-3-phosphate dehydrogenase